MCSSNSQRTSARVINAPHSGPAAASQVGALSIDKVMYSQLPSLCPPPVESLEPSRTEQVPVILPR